MHAKFQLYESLRSIKILLLLNWLTTNLSESRSFEKSVWTFVKQTFAENNLLHHASINLWANNQISSFLDPQPRPKSTNLVKIDTDVTITGVYVNSVSSQETICKTLKYRTAYSVTEECVVSRPPTQEPPKSYTPLSALTNMRPPGGQMPPEPCKNILHRRDAKEKFSNEFFYYSLQGMTSPSDQYQPTPMFDPHMGPMPPYHYPPQQQPPAPTYPPHPMPSTSSAFYPPQQVHRDPMGESIQALNLNVSWKLKWQTLIESLTFYAP